MLTGRTSLVVIAELDVVRVAVSEAETDPPLIVDGDRVLAFPVPFQRMEPIAGRHPEVFEAGGHVHVLELPQRAPRQVRGDTTHVAGDEERLGASVGKGLDHRRNVTRHVTRVNTCLDRLTQFHGMTPHALLEEILKLPPEQRLQLVEDIWASLAKSEASVPVPAWHRDELDRRLADPAEQASLDWGEV